MAPVGNDSIFGKIIRREIPASIVYETDKVLAFRDVNPQAPIHVLIIPKIPIRDMNCVSESDRELLGELMLAAAEVARLEGCDLNGYRLVVNTGSDGGQTVFHLHIHLLAGRTLKWPPG